MLRLRPQLQAYGAGVGFLPPTANSAPAKLLRLPQTRAIGSTKSKKILAAKLRRLRAANCQHLRSSRTAKGQLRGLL